MCWMGIFLVVLLSILLVCVVAYTTYHVSGTHYIWLVGINEFTGRPHVFTARVSNDMEEPKLIQATQFGTKEEATKAMNNNTINNTNKVVYM